ncbi:MAG TPA: sulfonate ABC transporter permease [Clostridiales bacterium]|nr:sulfonate ABC transporter permease [Clostridiales bacterium]
MKKSKNICKNSANENCNKSIVELNKTNKNPKKLQKNNNFNENISDARKKYLKKQRNNKIFVISIRVLIFVMFFALWQILADVGAINVFVFSSPSKMLATVVDLFATGNLVHHMFITFYEAFLGFIIATVLGYLIAILLWWNERLRQILEPYIIILNSLPKVALGPIIIIWFGAGTKAIIVMAILIMIIITVISILNSFVSCDKNKILLMKSMGANKWQILTKLVIPNGRQEFMSVLKINVGMTWVGTIMGEYLVSKAGLGYLIVYGSQVFKLDLVMTSILILCLLAGLMYGLVCLIDKFISKKQ